MRFGWTRSCDRQWRLSTLRTGWRFSGIARLIRCTGALAGAYLCGGLGALCRPRPELRVPHLDIESSCTGGEPLGIVSDLLLARLSRLEEEQSVFPGISFMTVSRYFSQTKLQTAVQAMRLYRCLSVGVVIVTVRSMNEMHARMRNQTRIARTT